MRRSHLLLEFLCYGSHERGGEVLRIAVDHHAITFCLALAVRANSIAHIYGGHIVKTAARLLQPFVDEIVPVTGCRCVARIAPHMKLGEPVLAGETARAVKRQFGRSTNKEDVPAGRTDGFQDAPGAINPLCLRESVGLN